MFTQGFHDAIKWSYWGPCGKKHQYNIITHDYLQFLYIQKRPIYINFTKNKYSVKTTRKI